MKRKNKWGERFWWGYMGLVVIAGLIGMYFAGTGGLYAAVILAIIPLAVVGFTARGVRWLIGHGKRRRQSTR
jgi:hypothetical protein